LSTLAGHSDAVTTVAFTQDGTHVITTSNDKTVGVWDARTGSQTASLKHQRPVADTTISPDGTRLVTVGSDEGVSVWDVSSGQLLPVPGEPLGAAHAHAVAFGAMGAAVLAVGRDGSAQIRSE